eukprot:444668-Pleurochrysis_carterae.AAC.3
MWERDRLAKLEREAADAAARKAMNEAQKRVLDRQVHELHSYRTSEKELMAQEAELLRQQCELEQQEAKRVEQLRADMVARAHDELDSFNVKRRSQVWRRTSARKASIPQTPVRETR